MSSELVPAQPQQPNQWNVYGLAQQLAVRQDAAEAPNIATLREALNAELSKDFATSAAEDTLIRQKNAAFLHRVGSEVLPEAEVSHVTPGRWPITHNIFYTNDTFELRRLQSQLTWWHESIATGIEDIPSFMIGSASDEEYPDQSYALLLDANKSHGLRVAPINTNMLKSLDIVKSQLLHTPIDEDAYERMYSRSSNAFYLDATTPGNIKEGFRFKGLLRRNRWASRNSPEYIRRTGQVCFQQWYDRRSIVQGGLFEFGLSNIEMAKLGVYEHLGQLAALFEVSDKYQAILEKEGKTGQAAAASEPPAPAIENQHDDLR